jgi:peptide/nickel transport system permease protein
MTGRFLLRRLVLAVAVLLTVSMISFGLLHLSGDLASALAGDQASSQYVEFLRHEYGLDRPLPVQYGAWLGRVLSGDLGRSYYFGKPVTELLLERLPVTMTLGAMALAIALAFAVPAGMLAALRRDTWVDHLLGAIALGGQAMPTFWLGFLLIILFGVDLRWLPISGGGSVAHYVMPSLALAAFVTPAFLRITRGEMIAALGSDYVRTARALGHRPLTVLFGHALRNAILPVVSVGAVQAGFMLGGSIVVETVFALQGTGYLAWEAIAQNDYPVVQAVVLTMSAIFVLTTLIADLLNAALDPRIVLGA